jgi:predicted XRE-type DNA-binding protein
MNEEIDYELSSGNVFADLGHPDPEAALAKAKLARLIATIIDQHGWTQSQAATILGLDQPKVSALVRGRLRDFSIERLMRLLTRLDLDVEISAAPRSSPSRPARIAVVDQGEPIVAAPRAERASVD